VQEVAFFGVFKVSVQAPANDIVFLYIVKMRSDQSEGISRNGPKERLPESDLSDSLGINRCLSSITKAEAKWNVPITRGREQSRKLSENRIKVRIQVRKKPRSAQSI
jgi:hypothetical protein